ncbi:hypothetical protein Ccrd_017283 [Cynara cardunculus var. scolymus]|uniref:Uncharacterized protein n=1 Tax=Cynara cardunculus var. scolymus TaxID=59895 RepID=A0A103Y8C2_CYNCS|nr:hypothetical protein Ccrd_017283 [Cynara cardunculus var. scolymus]
MLWYASSLSLNMFTGLTHFDEILQEADGIILSCGNLCFDLPPEKFQQQLVVFVCFKFQQQLFLHQEMEV